MDCESYSVSGSLIWKQYIFKLTNAQNMLPVSSLNVLRFFIEGMLFYVYDYLTFRRDDGLYYVQGVYKSDRMFTDVK